MPTPGARHITLSEAELEALVARGAEAAAKSVLQKLGVDVDNPLATQKDFAWVRDKREAGKKLADAGKMALVTSAVTAVVTGLAAAWAIIQHVVAAGVRPPHGP